MCFELFKPTLYVSYVKKKNISIKSREHSYDILERIWLPFALVLKICLRLKWKVFELISLTKEISRQPSIDCVMWLLAVTLKQIYNEKEWSGQGEIQNV